MQNTIEPCKSVSSHDKVILRDLAARKAEYAASPENLERQEMWYRLDAGEAGGRPMVLIESSQLWREGFSDSILQCRDEWARGIEGGLRDELYRFETTKDDNVLEPFINMNWTVDRGNYGVESIQHTADNDGNLGARRWDPPIHDLDKDFDKLRPRIFSVNRQETLDAKRKMADIFGDILPVRMRGKYWWTMGMTIVAIDLIGLENLMLFMYDNPAGLHRLMAFLRDDHLAFAEWLEREGLLGLNNENDYIGSGSQGYTRDLPLPDWKPDAPARLKDLWVLLESQETVGVGPELFEEFVFPYQVAIAERFGKVYYGCCEPVHSRWNVLKKMPHLARVSVSPWADQAYMAEALGRQYVFSRKPNPASISTERFDETAIRADLRQTLKAAKTCRLEIIMKDVHTIQNHPQRLARWVAIAREEIAKAG